jgi:hypothetical protein
MYSLCTGLQVNDYAYSNHDNSPAHRYPRHHYDIHRVCNNEMIVQG